MAITNGYATLAEIRARLAISDPVDIGQDEMLERMVEAASRAIDSDTGQSFYAATAFVDDQKALLVNVAGTVYRIPLWANA